MQTHGDHALDDIALIVAAIDRLPDPPPHLDGWQSLAAGEYIAAALGIRLALAGARDAAARALR